MSDSSLLSVYRRSPLRFVSGKGAHLTDENGKTYLDFAAGVAVNSFGYAEPRLVKVFKQQAERLWHVSNLYQIPEQDRLAEKLVQASFAERVFFCNSGAEAVEGLIKIMRRYHAATSKSGAPERVEILTFAGAFHGRTLGALSAAGNAAKLDGFGPAAPGFRTLPDFTMDHVQAAMSPQCAGVLLEPVQGEGGIRPVPREFLQALRAFCDQHGILLGLDEVQSGMGRTGRLFAHEWANITPDLAVLAKSLGGGLPVGAVLATERAASGMTPGSHGSTFGGNPLAMTMGAAALDILLEDGFLEEVRRKAALLQQKLGALLEQHSDIFTELRGEGLMLGLACKVPAAELQARLREAGLLTLTASNNVLRLLPPLVITDADIATACEQLDDVASKWQTAQTAQKTEKTEKKA